MSMITRISNLHRIRRFNKFQKGQLGINAILMHSVFHRILLPAMSFTRKLRKDEIYILKDKRNELNNSPVIYACTHLGGFDIETLFEVIKDPCWLFLGNPNEIYFNMDGLLLWLNGVICLDIQDKQDRFIAKERAIELLKQGGNLLIFPEGTWNIYDNLPIMPLYWGTAEMAIRSKVPIIPIAIEKYEKTFYVNIGEAITEHLTVEINKETLTLELEECLSTLKWEIWEKHGIHKRVSIKSSANSIMHMIFEEKKTSESVESILRDRLYPNKKVI
jgi:1-acyl-sn-glycerol-3-phosphate acyltransferase